MDRVVRIIASSAYLLLAVYTLRFLIAGWGHGAGWGPVLWTDPVVAADLAAASLSSVLLRIFAVIAELALAVMVWRFSRWLLPLAALVFIVTQANWMLSVLDIGNYVVHEAITRNGVSWGDVLGWGKFAVRCVAFGAVLWLTLRHYARE